MYYNMMLGAGSIVTSSPGLMERSLILVILAQCEVCVAALDLNFQLKTFKSTKTLLPRSYILFLYCYPDALII
jgi:hypothetical protein